MTELFEKYHKQHGKQEENDGMSQYFDQSVEHMDWDNTSGW